MSKEKNNVEKRSKSKIIVVIFTIIALLISAFSIYEIFLLNSIENIARYVVIGILIFIDLLLIFRTKCILKNKKIKSSKHIVYLLFLIFYSITCGIIGAIIFYVYGTLNGINKVYVTYTSNLVTMSSNKADTISDIKDYTIGILNQKDSPDGYIIPQEIIKENKLNDDNDVKNYDNYPTMLADLYSGEVDAVFLPGGYETMFSNIDGYESITTDTKVILSKDKKMRKADTSKSETESLNKSINEPFTILLMGIDSTDEILTKNAVANGDTLILITFNPKTLSATMFSIPRDSYVPIACWPNKAENKITHAAGYGTDCMMDTIENYFDINIDYYAKINFKGLVKLVDAVGGVDINVEKELCTDDSSRGQEICIQPGMQTLNGEQALVYARNRKSLTNGDFGRAQHQQEIIKVLINKVKTINNVSKFMEILNTISNSLDTNLTTDQILSFYNVAKDIAKRSLVVDDADLIDIQQLYLQGDGQMIYDENMRMVLWNYVPNKDSRNDIVTAMKENLGEIDHQIIKEFNFSINNPYEKEVIGEGPYKTNYTYKLLPSFIGYSEATARSIANRYGITISFKGVNGTVIDQSYPANKRIDKIKGSVILTLSGKSTTNDNTNSSSSKSSTNDDSKDDEKIPSESDDEKETPTDDKTDEVDEKEDEE